MAVGSARRAVSLFVALLVWASIGTIPSQRAHAIEALDGRLQAHGFVEMQVRTMSEKFGVHGDEYDLAQWYNILNVEIELDILPDGWGPIDLMSAFVRVEARYDCIYTHGCAMFPSVNTFGDDAERLPRRLSDAKDPDYAGVVRVGDPVHRIQDKRPAPLGGLRETTTFGDLRVDIPDGVIDVDGVPMTPKLYRRGWTYATGNHPSGPQAGLPRCDPARGCPGVPGGPVQATDNPIYHDVIIERVGFPGFDTFFDLRGGDMIANTFDDPGLYLLGDYLDYQFALKKVKGADGGSGQTQIIGPWLPENIVHSRALLYEKANPLRGRLATSTYTATGAGSPNRRFYTRSTDLATLTDPRLQALLWKGATPADGYTDLVDPFPEEIDSFWTNDYYRTAPKDTAVGNPPSSNPNQKFGGDYNGIIPCVVPDRARTPSNPNSPDNRTILQRQLDGTDKNGGCIPFTNLRVTGGGGELPLRPAPDRSNLFAEFDQMYAQGLYVPSRGLLDYMENDDFDKSDFNISETERTWNRGASQQDNKELKEAYVDMEFLDSRLWVRAGLQNIVWGKTELFRTTDQFNPIDIALSGPLAGLEESRIALWSARAVYSFYSVGPLDDVRAEFAVNLDDFEPIDLGACGEPYTINFVCGIPLGLFAHGLLGVGIAGVDRPDSFWNDSKGLEFGGRVEWRWDRFSFALTDYWGYNDVPYADAIHYFDRGVEYALSTSSDELAFKPGVGRPLASGFETGCTGMWGGSGVSTWASANRDPRSYGSTSQAGIGRDPACLKPGGAAGGLNQNGFTVARDANGDVQFVRVDSQGVLVPGPGSTFVSDGFEQFPTAVVPITCTTPDQFADCEPMRYEVGLNEMTFNGALFSKGWSPQNALENHTANQQSFAFICAATLTIGAALDPTACAFNLFGSPKLLNATAAPFPLSEVVSCLMAGEIGNACQNFLAVTSNNLQGLPPTYESSIAPLNRDRNDGVITAQSRGGATATNPLGVGVFSRDSFLKVAPGQDLATRILALTQFLPGPEDMLTLDSTMTNEQRALLGCGPYFGTRCDTSSRSPELLFGIDYCNLLGTGCVEGGGMDFMNMEASALMQSFVGIEGTDLAEQKYTDNPEHPEWKQWAAGGENFNGTPWAGTGIWLTTSGLPQPGTMEFAGGPSCTRYVEELGKTIVLPGCRGVNAVLNRETARTDGEVVFRFDEGYDPDVDGCVLGQDIDGVPVRGVYQDGSSVDLSKCAASTHKIGGFYVWPCSEATGICETDANHVKTVPDLADYDPRPTSPAMLSRSGSATLWHPYAGCFLNTTPSAAINDPNGIPCIQVPQEDIDDVKATSPTLAARLAWGQTGTKFPGQTPRRFERAFFIKDGDVVDGRVIEDAFNVQSQIFRSEMAAFSHNFMTFLVQASCDGDEDDVVNDPECFDPQRQFKVGKCSYVTPQLCGNVKGFFGAAGVQRNVAKAGGNEKYGRRDFLWHSGGELALRYQQRNVLGFSLDFSEDYTASSWGMEFTWVNKQNFFNNDDFDDQVSQSGVLNLTVSVDRPTFINFLNQNRTFFINSQWFFQYITDYEDGFVQTGPLNVLFTIAAFTGYFQDRLNPQLVTVYDFMSRSGGILPSVAYRFTDSLSVAFGMNLFFGQTDLIEMPVRGFAPVGNRAGSEAYQDGIDNAISSFRDKDEFWMKVRWTF